MNQFLFAPGKAGAGLLLMFFCFFLKPVSAASSGVVNITATVIATCSLSVPPTLDIGDILASDLSSVGSGKELNGYAKNLPITTSCTGVNNYKLTFSSSAEVGYGCLLAANSLGFCLYKPDGSKLSMASSNKSVQGSATNNQINLAIVPISRGGNPKPGSLSVSLNVAIEPL